MALTQSAWTESAPNGGQQYVASCTVVSTTAENDAYTLPVPKGLDTRKPFSLYYKAAATPDGSALPLDLWVGYGDSFVLSGDGASVAATNGARFKQVFDDVVLAVSPVVYVINFDPELPVADVVTVAAISSGPKVRTPSAPRIAFNLNGASTLAATTHTFVVVQNA